MVLPSAAPMQVTRSPASPVELRLVGESRAAAGEPGSINVQEAMRIATGAPLPGGSDAMVPVENAIAADDCVRLTTPVSEGSHIRRATEDVQIGDRVIPTGVALGAGELALLAALGHPSVTVRKRPRVAVLVTGDELVPPGGQAGPGQIYDSNSIGLSGLVREAGAELVLLERVADTASATTAALERASACADLVISCGGVSVGPYDLVKEALGGQGTVDHWRVAMQPGKPLVIGKLLGLPFLGLPGNPVSAHVTFEQFARPAIKKMVEHMTLLRPRIRARLTRSLRGSVGRRFVRVRLTQSDEHKFDATPTGAQGSHIHSSLVDCHGLAVIPEDREGAEPGDLLEVEVWRLPGH